jgi:hypothetical protein
MVFDGQLSVGILNLVLRCGFLDFQNFERIKLFLNLLRIVFLKEVFFSLSDLILIEEILENFVWISWF